MKNCPKVPPASAWGNGGIRRRLIASLVALMMGLAPAVQAQTAQDAAGCAAFYLANADFETDLFDAPDRDPAWTAQAQIFRQIARRMNLSDAEIDKIIARDRRPLKRMIEGFVLDLDAASRRIFITRSETCDRIIETAPEFAHWR